MLLTPALFDSLTALARTSPRLRQHYDLRDSEEDGSQRMLNALEPGTVILECKDGKYDQRSAEMFFLTV
jgi:cupin fold WbuC family metalloprotein